MTTVPWTGAGFDAFGFDRTMTDVVARLRDTLMRQADMWEEEPEAGRSEFDDLCKTASQLAIFEVVDGLDRLLPGVGFSTPYRRYNHASTLRPAVTISINPIDGLEKFRTILTEGKRNRMGVFVNVALCVGGAVVAAYSIDLYGGQTLRVAPHENALSMARSDGSSEFLVPGTESFGLSDEVLHLYGDRAQYKELLELVGQPDMGPGTFLGCEGVPQSHVGALNGLIWEMGAALAMPANTLAAPWAEWPMLKLAEAAKIRLFRAADGALRELPRTPVTSPTTTVDRNYMLLFVPDRYVAELGRQVPLQPLA